MYYKNLKINGVEYPFAVNITGEGAPTSSTEAEVGMFYMDETNGKIYKFTPDGWKPCGVEQEEFDGIITAMNERIDAAGGGGSSSYGYVEVASPYFIDYDKDGDIITDEAMKELHRKALWYRVHVKTQKVEYGNPDPGPNDEYDETREYETEGLFFPRKNLSTLGSCDGVEGLFLPFYFKHGLYGYTLQGINLIPEPLKGYMSWDGEGYEGVGYIIFNIDGWFHQFTDDDIESGYEGTRTHYELINCGGDTDRAGYAACGDLWVEAYVPIENTSSNYSLRRDYTEYELEMKAKVEARIAARKAKKAANT